MAIWIILRTFWDIYDHLAHFVFIWYIFSSFGIMYQEKSGNPGLNIGTGSPGIWTLLTDD
jgi:hypothetical protein